MRPLFPDKDKIELISGPNDVRRKYKINIDCKHMSPHQEKTGNQIVDGDYYQVPTDAGELAVVWAANDQSIAEDLKYYCHGHSFGTYKKFGYSLAEVDHRILDEWDIVGKTANVTRTGSEVNISMIDGLHQQLREARSSHHLLAAVGLAKPSIWDHLSVSWESGSLKFHDNKTIHSFRIRAVSNLDQVFLESIASSKNTFGHFEKETTIRGQLNMYKDIVALTFLRSKSAKNND